MTTATADTGVEPGMQADQRLLDRGWLRIGAGLAVAGQAMVFSLAVNISEIDGASYAVVHGILILAAIGTLALLGRDLVRSAWESVRDRVVSIDLLFLVTLLGALIGSLVSTFARTGSVYYEVVAILIVVHTAGKMLGARSRLAALRAVSATRDNFGFCDVVEGSSVRQVRVEDVAAGQHVRVTPGAGIAVDGRIVAGRGYVQETSMTGEWRPVVRDVGDDVMAGTYSVDGSFVIECRGGTRKLDEILREIERARLAPSVLQEQADRLMAWFLPLVVGASIVTFLVWLNLGPWGRALYNAMAVLLVACPCAMGLATPVAVWSGLARLAQLGVIARTGDFLDRLARAEVICLDKTGTLSKSGMHVRGWRWAGTFSEPPEVVHAAVLAGESGLNHPVAEALRRHLGGATEALGELIERKIVPGEGVLATVRVGAGEPIVLAIGERTLVSGAMGDSAVREPFVGEAKTISVFWNGALAAEVELGETWREGLVETLNELSTLGVQAEVLSGDPAAESVLREVVQGTAGARATPVTGGMTPLAKAARVAELQRQGKVVAFAGDGLNDAAALSAADASISVKAGTDLTRAAAMAVLAGDDLRSVPAAIRVGREVRQSVRSNLLFAATYNLFGVALAAFGLLHPVVAALLMFGSSLFVSVRALRSSARAG